ncbi:radical SAM protein [Bacteroidota bacterium]
MIDGSARGNISPGVESLSVKELSLWAPGIIRILSRMGITVNGNEESSLSFICEEAGVSHIEVIQMLSTVEPEEEYEIYQVNTLKIKSGKDKSGNPEPVDELIINAGEVVAIVGPTGSGKSQMLSDVESLACGDSPSGRTIFLDGKLPDDELRWSPSIRPVAQISQSMNFLLDISVEEFLEMHLASRASEDAETLKHRVVEAACTLCGEPFGLQHQIVSLSGGQSRALMIADAALVSSAPIILVDEIENAGIDRNKAMKFLVGEGKISLVATHDPLLALRANRRIILKNGAMSKVFEKSAKEKTSLSWLEKRDSETMSLRENLRQGKRLDDMDDFAFENQSFPKRKIRTFEKNLNPEIGLKIMNQKQVVNLNRFNKKRKTGPKTFDVPPYITFDITHHCNLSCTHCSTNSSPKITSEGGLSTSEALNIIDQLSIAGVKVLTLSGGEPLLRKDWHVLAKNAVISGMVVNIETNGSTINAQTADLIMKSGINSINISLDSHKPEVHDKIRQCEGAFWRTIRSILLLTDRNIKTGIVFTPTKHNWKDADKVIELANHLSVDSLHLNHFVPTGRGRPSISLEPMEKKLLNEKWIRKQKKYRGKLNLIWHDCRALLLMPTDGKENYIGCGAGNYTARILPDGTLTPCAYLPMAAGSLRTTAFIKLWRESELLKNLRERNGRFFGNCSSCEHLNNCGGCRASAYAYGKSNPYSGDRQCWIEPIDKTFSSTPVGNIRFDK